jgi:hypothetical protein
LAVNPHPRKRLLPWTLTSLWLCYSTLALAGNTQGDAARAAARSAGYEGIQAYESGNLTVAVEKLGRAFNVVKVPTLGLWYARALAKTGNLVEAYERYAEVTRLEVTEGKIKEQKQAQADAAADAEALKPRIPILTLTVRGASNDCEVTLDGTSVPTNLLGMATPINPGTHRIMAKQDGEVVEREVTLAEGEKKALELELKSKRADATSVAPSTTAGSKQSPASGSDSTKDASSQGSTQKTIGWITLGVGGVATVAGAVTGALVLSKRGQLDDSGACKDNVCTSAQHDQLASYNQMRTLSSVGFVVGVVGIGVGTTLLLTTPKPKRIGVNAWVGIGSLGVKGSFQ